MLTRVCTYPSDSGLDQKTYEVTVDIPTLLPYCKYDVSNRLTIGTY